MMIVLLLFLQKQNLAEFGTAKQPGAGPQFRVGTVTGGTTTQKSKNLTVENKNRHGDSACRGMAPKRASKQQQQLNVDQFKVLKKATRRVTLRAQCTGLITRCPFSASTMTPFQQLMTYRGGHRLLEHFELIHVELLLLLACSLGSHAPARRVTVTVFIFNGQVFLFLRESVVYWYSI